MNPSSPFPLLLVLSAVQLVAQVPAATTGAANVRNVQLPLLDCAGLLCIEAAAGNGQTLRLILDLGARNAYLDTKSAQRLSVVPAAAASNEPTAPVQQATLPGLRLLTAPDAQTSTSSSTNVPPDLPMGDFPFMVLDTTPDPTVPKKVQSKPLPADGALTYGAFANRLVQLDLAHHILRVSEPLPDAQPCPAGAACRDLVIKHMGGFGPVTLTVQGFTVNHHTVDAQIDTLFTGTILLYPKAVEPLGIRKLSRSKHKEPFPYTQDGLLLSRADGLTLGFDQVTLLEDGPAYFWAEKDEAPSATQFDATVGTGLLAHAIVNFDFKANRFWLEPAPDSH